MRRRFTIQLTIMISFLMVLVIACGSIIFYNYSKTSKAFMDDLESDIQGNIEIILNNIESYFVPAKISTQFIAWFSKRDNTVLDSADDIIFQSLKLLDLYPQIAGFYNGDADGNFLAINRVIHPATYPYAKDKKLPANAIYSVRTINRNAGIITEFHKFLDQNGRTIAVQERPRANEYFDPRSRPWYVGAEKTLNSFWSNPYIFKLSRNIGITAATPVVHRKNDVRIVVSADITLNVISDLMAKHKLGKTGVTFILNEDGGVVGYPGLGKMMQGANTGLPSYIDIKNPVLLKAFNLYKKEKKENFELKHNKVNYLIRFHDFGSKFGKKWILGFIIPEHELTGTVNEMTELMLWFSLIILSISIVLIFIISSNIAKPIKQAAKSMSDISKFKIEDQGIKDSPFTEIQIMNTALRQMQQSLRDFSRFVPKAVVGKLIESGSGARIGGKKRHISLMFTDIKGFTSISETMSSEKLIRHLSDYLNQMTHIIQAEHGTIDKYIGDAIMTFWGAPVDDGDHPLQACRAALRCKEKLEELNKTWVLDGKPAFETRFGVHTGDAIVGNVGSEDRLNYSAFGDSVNLAARLEGINKYYGTSVIISHETYKNVRHQFICRPIDIVAVKGKKEGIRIYELLMEKSNDHSKKLDLDAAINICELTEIAIMHYKNKEWTKALKAYTLLQKEKLSDPIPGIFIERIKAFKKKSPPKDWTGIWIMKEK